MASLVKNTQKRIVIDTTSVAVLLNSLKSMTGFDSWDVAVWLCSDATIRQHNKEFRFISKSTDVLSFAAHSCTAEPEDFKNSAGPVTDLGDMLISPSYVWRWSQRHGVQPEEQLARVITHGFVHLLGYDHTTLADDTRMLAKEGALLEALPLAAQTAGVRAAQVHCTASGVQTTANCKAQRLASSALDPVPALGERMSGCVSQKAAGTVLTALLQPCPLCGVAPAPNR